jgi:hypothetical protein
MTDGTIFAVGRAGDTSHRRCTMSLRMIPSVPMARMHGSLSLAR